MQRFLASLRSFSLLRPLSSSSVTLVSLSVVPAATSLPNLQQAARPEEDGSRIYILGKKREEEMEASEALRALRAYSMASSPETVAVNIKVDMTLKKVR